VYVIVALSAAIQSILMKLLGLQIMPVLAFSQGWRVSVEWHVRFNHFHRKSLYGP
jgi:hypothetical protein